MSPDFNPNWGMTCASRTRLGMTSAARFFVFRHLRAQAGARTSNWKQLSMTRLRYLAMNQSAAQPRGFTWGACAHEGELRPSFSRAIRGAHTASGDVRKESDRLGSDRKNHGAGGPGGGAAGA